MSEATYIEPLDDKDLQPQPEEPGVLDMLTDVDRLPLAVKPAPLDPMLAMLERACTTKDFDIAKMEKIIQMRDDTIAKREAEIAKREFDKDFSKLQGEIPSMVKSAVVNFKNKNGTRTNYTYTTFEDIVSQTRTALCKNGFSISHVKTHRNEKVTVETTLHHAGGHAIMTTDAAPADITGNKNGIQARISTASYLKRSNICDLLNIATKDADDDGKAGGDHFITPKQVELINKLLDDTEADKVKFIRDYMKVKSINEILAGDYNKAINALEIKRKAVQSNENTH